MTRPALPIRPSRPDEGLRAVEIWRAAVAATHDFVTPKDRAEIDREVQDFLPRLPMLFAVDGDDRPIGFMVLGDGSLEALFIDGAFHGRGVGRRMVEHALALHPVLTVQVNAGNDQAVGFYERMGFVETGRTEHDSRGRPYPLILMRCERPKAG